MMANCRAALRHRGALLGAVAGVALGLNATAALAQVSTGTGGPANPGGANTGQNTNSGVSIGPSQELSQPTAAAQAAVAAEPAVPHLLPDFGGVRTRLGNLGINLVLDDTNEFAGNISGGTRQLNTDDNQLGLEGDFDLEKLAGLTGTSFHVVVVNRAGAELSHNYGDNYFPAQEVYGAGGNTAAHLVYAYLEQSLLGGKIDAIIGRTPVSDDFAASPLYCNYMTNAICGNPKPLPGGDIGFSSYPDGIWGSRVRVRPVDNTYIQAGVYEVNGGIYNYKYFRSGFEGSALDTSRDIGVEFPVEAAYEPTFGAANLPGHYKLGFAWDDSSFTSLLNPNKTKHGKLQEWALADQMVLRNGPGPFDGLIVLAGYSHSDGITSQYEQQYFAGAQAKGFIPGRPADGINFLFTYNEISGPLGRAEGEALNFLSPAAYNATFGTAVPGISTHEEVLELNYNIAVYRGVNVQPTFQYVFRPNGQGNIPDAAILGIKSHVTF